MLEVLGMKFLVEIILAVLGMKLRLTAFFFEIVATFMHFSGCSMSHKKQMSNVPLRRIDTFRRFSAEPDTALDETEVWHVGFLGLQPYR